MEWEYFDMNSTTRIPVTAAIFSAATILLSGCIAYDAARTTVDAGSAVIGIGVGVISTTADVATAPFGHDDKDSDKSK
jgi:hypothetical protein